MTPTGAQIQTGQPGTSQTPPDAVAPTAAPMDEEQDPDKRPEGACLGGCCVLFL